MDPAMQANTYLWRQALLWSTWDQARGKEQHGKNKTRIQDFTFQNLDFNDNNSNGLDYDTGEDGPDTYIDVSKREPYGFGIGKREPYGFGIGKRAPYGFGIGKRAPYGFGIGKREPYNFGIGKRALMWGKRQPYNFGVGKRGMLVLQTVNS